MVTCWGIKRIAENVMTKTCYNDDRSIDQEHAQNVLNIGRVVRMHEDLHYPKINVATVSLNTAI